MTGMMWLVIAIPSAGGLLIIAGILTHIDWRGIWERRFADNPLHARVYIEFGEHVRSVDGEYIYSDEKAAYYEYDLDKQQYTVAYPLNSSKYPFKFVMGRLMIKVRFGMGVAIPSEYDAAQTLETEFGAEALDAALRGEAGVAVIRNIKSHGKFGDLKTWIIVIVIAVAAVFVFKTFMDKDETPAQQPAATQPAARPDRTIEDVISDSGGQVNNGS